MRQPWMLTGFLFGRGQARETRHGRRIVHRVVRLGRDERRMRPQQRQMRDEWTACALDVVDGFAHEERGVVEFRRILERLWIRRAVFVVGTGIAIAVREANVSRHLETASIEPIGPWRRSADHQTYGADAGQRTFVTLEPRIVGVETARILARVGVAEQNRIVAVRRRFPGPIGVARIERSAVGPRAMILQIHPGVERRATRTAWRGVGEVTPEENAVGGERVEIRRANDRMIESGETIAAPLVGGDEQYVERRSHRQCFLANSNRRLRLASSMMRRYLVSTRNEVRLAFLRRQNDSFCR